MEKVRKETAVESGIAESEWRSLHPVTPLAKTWAVFAAFFAFIFYQFADLLKELTSLGLIETYGPVVVFLAIAAGILVIIIVAGIYSWIAWRKMGFAITHDAVYYREGILFRSQRHARLDRIQAVNITHPLIGRIFGLGRIDVEVAGGANSNFQLGLLKTQQLEEVRREVLSQSRTAKLLKAGRLDADITDAVTASEAGAASIPLEGGQAGTVSAFSLDEPGEEFEQVIYKVPAGRLAASLALNMGIIFSILVGLAIAVGSVVGTMMQGASFAAMIPVLLGALALFAYPFNQFTNNFGFTALVTRDGIRIRSGLLSTRAQTIPVQRIHAVTVSQPFFWRIFGWYRVKIVQAGFAADAQDKVDHAVLLPVGTREEMLQALWMVYPDLGVPNPVETIMYGLEGEGTMLGFSQNPQRSRLFDPLVWRRRSIKLTDVAIMLRDGFITRSFSIITYDRLQSTRIAQGPWDRKRDLAGIYFHLVESNSRIDHLDAAQASSLHAEITRRATISRQKESQEAWAARAIPGANQTHDAYAGSAAGGGLDKHFEPNRREQQ
ncbi:PH domain-containing protein [Gleimia europaea]|uniref:YdbS-like PH domain-containing protein n=1 Tax=Gleimia europaea ACS-120-V-Col10b TaxID=883069 RepID=A0A9W5RFP9_9ACTO|nr:PH domain-containing protein [Gleimia europaea]EPD31619.1 hypothetical protein HMPREF9238_01396 [Gleimia europaea ACS-120-V-Col10b]